MVEEVASYFYLLSVRTLRVNAALTNSKIRYKQKPPLIDFKIDLQIEVMLDPEKNLKQDKTKQNSVSLQ